MGFVIRKNPNTDAETLEHKYFVSFGLKSI